MKANYLKTLAYKYEKNLLISAYLNSHCIAIAEFLGEDPKVVCKSIGAVNWKDTVLNNHKEMRKEYERAMKEFAKMILGIED